jgi:hypothetical protein
MFTVKELIKALYNQTLTKWGSVAVAPESKCLKFKWIPRAGFRTAQKNRRLGPSVHAADPKLFN